MEIKPLLFSPSPRDIKTVFAHLKETGFPRLYSKYFPEKMAYNLAREWFLKHEEYTHFVICPDDLIVKKEHIESLIQDLEENDYPVLSGVCNVDKAKNKDYLSITENLPHPQRMVPERNLVGWRWYSWVHKDSKFEMPIMSFPFSGFAAQFIRRDVMKRYRFIDDAKYNGTPDLLTGAIDVMFSNTCAIEKLPIMVDTRIRMEHLKAAERFFDIVLGDGELRFYPKNSDDYSVEYAEEKGQQRHWKLTGGDVIEGIVSKE